MPNVTFVDIIAKSRTVEEIAVYLDCGIGTTYVVRHEYPKGTSDAKIRAAIKAKIAAFVPPAAEVLQAEERLALVKELLEM